MAVLLLTQGADNPILRTKSVPIQKIDRKIKELAKDMTETMSAAQGVGIAAPQVGKNIRLFIARFNHDTDHELVVPMINPEILELGDTTEDAEEGCLSLPKRFGITPRRTSVTVKYTDLKNQTQTLHLEGFNAKIIQHETDHLDGKLFIDRMKREIMPEEREKNS